MPELSYRIGGLIINKDALENKVYACESGHRYVVKGEDDTVSIYVAELIRPKIIKLKEFKLDEKTIVSGGSLHLDKGILVMDDYSQQGTTPKRAAKEFAGQIMLELQSMGIEVTDIFVNPTRPFPGMVKVHPYWEGVGLDFE